MFTQRFNLRDGRIAFFPLTVRIRAAIRLTCCVEGHLPVSGDSSAVRR